MLIDKIKNVLSEGGNAFRYRLLYATCFVIHTFYAILFGCTDVTPLMVFNIISSFMYFTGMMSIRNNKFTVIWLVLVNAEIIMHGVLCCFFLGYNYQFSLFSISIMPVTYFFAYLDPRIGKPITFSSIIAAVNSFVMLYSLHQSNNYEPFLGDKFPPTFVNALALFNLSVTILITLVFSIVFVEKISLDMKSMKEQYDKLDFLANYDQLTGLRNRNHIRDIFEQYIKSTDPYCVILGDIDDFKHVNDTYGHTAGDDVLRTISEIISRNVGDNGVVCRWGGEEILILVKGSTEDCIALNRSILDEIRGTTVVSGRHRIKITMTFGLCDYSDAMDIEKLISLADKRLYIGKNNGKNQVVTKS